MRSNFAFRTHFGGEVRVDLDHLVSSAAILHLVESQLVTILGEDNKNWSVFFWHSWRMMELTQAKDEPMQIANTANWQTKMVFILQSWWFHRSSWKISKKIAAPVGRMAKYFVLVWNGARDVFYRPANDFKSMIMPWKSSDFIDERYVRTGDYFIIARNGPFEIFLAWIRAVIKRWYSKQKVVMELIALFLSINFHDIRSSWHSTVSAMRAWVIILLPNDWFDWRLGDSHSCHFLEWPWKYMIWRRPF